MKADSSFQKKVASHHTGRRKRKQKADKLINDLSLFCAPTKPLVTSSQGSSLLNA